MDSDTKLPWSIISLISNDVINSKVTFPFLQLFFFVTFPLTQLHSNEYHFNFYRTQVSWSDLCVWFSVRDICETDVTLADEDTNWILTDIDK